MKLPGGLLRCKWTCRQTEVGGGSIQEHRNEPEAHFPCILNNDSLNWLYARSSISTVCLWCVRNGSKTILLWSSLKKPDCQIPRFLSKVKPGSVLGQGNKCRCFEDLCTTWLQPGFFEAAAAAASFFSQLEMPCLWALMSHRGRKRKEKCLAQLWMHLMVCPRACGQASAVPKAKKLWCLEPSKL